MLDTFGTRWSELRAAAVEAERAGFDGVWLNDHLAGSVEGAPDVLECWTALSALAEAVPRIAIGSLVLNVANRDPGTLAVMAATLQEVSSGYGSFWVSVPGPSEEPRLRLSRRRSDARRPATRSGVAPSSARSPWCGRSGRAPCLRPRGFCVRLRLPPIVVAGLRARRWPRSPVRGRRMASAVPVGSTMARGPGGRGQTSPRPVGPRSLAVPGGRDPSSSGLGPSGASTIGLGVDRLIVYAARAPLTRRWLDKAAHLLRRSE